AEETATQAEAAAAAYETAFAATVPPAEIAANRTQLASLVSTNFLGLNTPAIAATEAQYGEMWGQDASAMYGYAGSSAAASRLTEYGPPQPIVNPAATTAQSTAVAQAASTAVGTASDFMGQAGSSAADAAGAAADGAAAAGLAQVAAPVGGVGAVGNAVSAGLGAAPQVGGLTVPASWTGAAPQLSSAINATPM